MLMPVWLIATIVLSILNLFWCRSALLACVIAFVACSPAIWNFSPLNVVNTNAQIYKGYPTFTLLTYNVANFSHCDSTLSDDYNHTLSYILKTDADVVCLQEGESLFSNDLRHYSILQEQVDSIFKAYPYVLLHKSRQILLSKYPAKALPTSYNSKGGNGIAAYRLNIQGVPVTLFNVHLQSYSLSKNDKSLYHNITEMNRDDKLKSQLINVKSQLIRKIQRAAELRERDAEKLGHYVQHYAGENAIIAGDFNDVPGCYTLQRMADFNFKQVYSKVGFGPTHTFNADRFYFRIDHILYRGNMEPILIWRGNTKASDHYPLFTAFALTGD